MTEVIGTGPWRVTVTEYDRFMGPKIDSYRRFASEEEGLAWARKYNSVNDKAEVPEWYMAAAAPSYVP